MGPHSPEAALRRCCRGSRTRGSVRSGPHQVARCLDWACLTSDNFASLWGLAASTRGCPLSAILSGLTWSASHQFAAFTQSPGWELHHERQYCFVGRGEVPAGSFSSSKRTLLLNFHGVFPGKAPPRELPLAARIELVLTVGMTVCRAYSLRSGSCERLDTVSWLIDGSRRQT